MKKTQKQIVKANFFKKLSLLNILRIFHYLRQNGVRRTFFRICREFNKSTEIKLGKKRNIRVLFIPSDNNKTSGAFLSMINLNMKLKKLFNIETLIILPNEGNGEVLLKKNNLMYCFVDSFDWTIPMNNDENSNKKLIDMKRKANKQAIETLKKIIIDYKFDLVHINTTYSYVGAMAAIETDVPYIWHLREFLEEDQNRTLWDRNEGNALINMASKVVTISESLYNKYKYIIDGEKLVKIYNGIDADIFYNKTKSIFNHNIVRFIMIGSFEEYKGQKELAKACTILKEKGFTDFELWFIGTGREEIRKEVEFILTNAGIDNKMRYYGYKENVIDYLLECDISFTCAKSEAFGRTTVEAMLSGNLVIGADTAGTKELIEDGITGILYKQGDAEDLANKVLSILNDRDRAKRIANNGREYMAMHMTSKTNAENIYKLYLEVLSKKN